MTSDMRTYDLPPKLRELIDAGWTFPTTFPVVNNTHSPDAAKTLKQVIEYSIKNYYFDYRVNSYVTAEFTRSFTTRLYNKMAQHQYWIDQYLGLIDDNQFFYNDETDTLSKTVAQTGAANSTNKVADTPQNQISDINDYLTSAETDAATSSQNATETNNNTIHKSTLGDITVQFTNFAHFPSFIDQLLDAVAPCFIKVHNYEDINYGPTV